MDQIFNAIARFLYCTDINVTKVRVKIKVEIEMENQPPLDVVTKIPQSQSIRCIGHEQIVFSSLK